MTLHKNLCSKKKKKLYKYIKIAFKDSNQEI